MWVLLVADPTEATRQLTNLLQKNNISVIGMPAPSTIKPQGWEGPHDVILLDQVVQGVDMRRVLRSWRHEGLAANVLVLLASAKAEDRVRYLDLGADACLARPFEFAELLARLRALARRHWPGREPLLRCHDLEIDTQARAVRRAGQRIALRPREYALLELLARHRGHVVLRQTIHQHFYEGCRRVLSNIVEVFISHLRRKIDKGFALPLILTERGQGYMLRGDSDAEPEGPDYIASAPRVITRA
ncbi:MAG: response regulator transcription factor [Gemmataceae bacterium]|nr:response regulator transcription factor [Gemmataceae bacterium]